ncbi:MULTISPECIES: M48 family metalloprotease [Sphingomonas]|uniref:M48 family metalloprotease n=1 Tax=Sphingomonas TaxID=13687 RepID=UPI000DEFF85F|nr:MULTISPECIES: M48 family metalloprotease [Sphingomonas]
MIRKSLLLLGAALVAAAPGLGTAQTTGRQLSPRYVQEAQRDNAALVAEFGGAETGARAAYVSEVGRRMAAQSGVDPRFFRFTTLNSAVENAFSVPGGYVYLTRQLMGLMNNEAELAFVMGHEVGHVAADHAQAREQASRRNSVGGILGVILGSVIGGGFGDAIGQMAAQSSALRTLSFSRAQEYQADQLGVAYLTRAGYDPMASATMLAALARADALELRVQGRGSRQTPEWAQTHPNSENRVVQAAQLARQTGRAGAGVVNRDAFLAQVNGVTVDDDPAQGIIDGRTFTHPDLKLQFSVPAGYLMQNGTDAVSISGSAGKAEFSTARFTGDLQAYMAGVLQELTDGKIPLQVTDTNRISINGIPAAYVIARAQTSSGVVDVSVFAYQFSPTQAYHFVMITQGGQGVGAFVPMVNSLRRISAAEAAQIRPRVIEVVTVRPGDTVQSLGNRMAYRDYQVERFVSLNGLAANARLVPGQKVKLVVLGTRNRS